jgi:hypothetical protein
MRKLPTSNVHVTKHQLGALLLADSKTRQTPMTRALHTFCSHPEVQACRDARTETVRPWPVRTTHYYTILCLNPLSHLKGNDDETT